MNYYSKWLKFTVICGLPLLFPQLMYSQDCPNVDIELLTQDDVDNFSANYPNCTELKRDLCIGKCNGSPQPYAEITNLQGLTQIEKISGDLDIKFTTGLTNLTGLENLTTVNHNVWLKTNEDLMSLSGLENLEYIGCDLKLEFLPINTLDGLGGIDTILGNVEIVVNAKLTSLDGIANANYPGSGLKIVNNVVLESIEGLASIKSIQKSVHITGCPNLTSLNGLHNIETIGGQLEIGSNDGLESLEGLESLTHVGTTFSISYNDNLLNLMGAGKLKSTDKLTITENPSLITLEGLDQLETAIDISISSNNSLLTLDGLNKLSTVDFFNLTNNPFTSISGLSDLRSVGTLLVTENSLTDLSGFQLLDSIESMRITRNSQLQNLGGLKETIFIKYLTIRENEILSNIQGLAIDSVYYLTLTGNQNMVNLEGANIRAATVLKIEGNPSLIQLKGLDDIEAINAIGIYDNPILENLEYINIEDDGELLIKNNSALVDLSGLDSISDMGMIRISENENLASFDGLESLIDLGFIEISENPALINIYGLRNVVPENNLEFFIINNPLLTECNITIVCEAYELLFQTALFNNGPGCNSPDDLSCSNFVSGELVFDYNENGIIDIDDILLEGVQVSYDNREQIKYSKADGSYKYFVNDEEEVSISFVDTSLWVVTAGQDSYQFQYDSDLTPCCDYDFLLDFKNKTNDAIIDIVLPNLRCNSEVDLQLQYSLVGGREGEGTVVLFLDPLSEFVSSDPMPTSQVGNKLEWDFLTTRPFQKQIINLTIATPDETFIGEKLNFSGEIYVTAFGSDPVSVTGANGIVRCSFDPNDKQIQPYSESGYTNFDDSTLVFTVRFQNTGNAEAINVVLKDTLSEYLDAQSLRVISTSHSSILEVSRINPNFVTFDFPNIFLIDSLTNPTLSQGYVQYSVNIKSGLSPGTVIENKAHIYFDNNPSIITNTTRNEFYFDLDQDGFLSIEDCNDENGNINPMAIEVSYNGEDDDCNPETIDDDFDQDGFLLVDDCDDTNSNINPDQTEEPYNGIDDDCNPETLDDDIDQDGFLLADDCDDTNSNINPDQTEEPYNNIDDDCNAATLDDDLDQDGFLLVDDCDDNDSNINPDAEEIPNNGIDEDCDGMDLVSSTYELDKSTINIYPNPVIDIINIDVSGNLEYSANLYDLEGKLIISTRNQTKIQIQTLPQGTYLLEIKDINSGTKVFERIVKGN